MKGGRSGNVSADIVSSLRKQIVPPLHLARSDNLTAMLEGRSKKLITGSRGARRGHTRERSLGSHPGLSLERELRSSRVRSSAVQGADNYLQYAGAVEPRECPSVFAC